MEGMEVFGLAEEAIQAGLQEVQLIQELGDLLLPVLMVTGGQGPVEMLEMTGQRLSMGFRFTVFGFRFSVRGSGERLSGKGVRGQHGWET
jgi:hypothetical protein